MLHAIEKATRQKIDMMELPSTEAINNKRISAFKQRITDTLANSDLGFFNQLIEQYHQEHNVPAIDIAAALGRMVQGTEPLLLTNKPKKIKVEKPEYHDRQRDEKRSSKRGRAVSLPEEEMESYRIEVGRTHGVKPGNIVGAIANEAGLDSEFIGRINIYDDFSTVDLPEGMPRDSMRVLKRAWVAGQQLQISKLNGAPKEKKDKKRKKINKKKNAPVVVKKKKREAKG